MSATRSTRVVVRAKRGVHAAFFAALACTGSSAVHANERTSSLSSIEGGAPTIDVRADRVGPRVATWEELARDGFDLAWILPEELPVARDDGKGPAVDLVTELQRLLALRDETAGSTPATFGDVVLAVRRAGGTAEARDRVFAELRAARPKLARELEPALRELLADETLRSRAWDPEKDDARDGLWFARPLTLAGIEGAPWDRIEGSKLVQQAAAFVVADLDAIKAVENDYRAYPARPGAAYEEIHALRDTYRRGKDARGEPFAALRIRFRCDLPFPFSTYTCELAILNRIGRDGHVRCDIASTSRDFLWLAGRDVFLPVRASDGTWLGTLVVRWFGFDLRGVPDGDDARRAGLRSSLGSLKREAEAEFTRGGAVARTIDGAVPEFEVRGAK